MPLIRTDSDGAHIMTQFAQEAMRDIMTMNASYIGLFCENKRLQEKLEVLEQPLEVLEQPVDAMSELDRKVIAYAKDHLLDEFFIFLYKDLSGPLSFGEWAMYCCADSPSWMSEEDLIAYLHDELREIYDRRLDEYEAREACDE